MLRILTVLCLIGAIFAASIGDESTILDKFAKLKLMSSCLGEDATMSLKTRLQAATAKCMSSEVKEAVTDFETMMKDMMKTNSQDLMQYLKAFQTKHPIDLSTASKIKDTKTTVNSAISNVTCVLKEMKHIDANNQPNYEFFKEQINNLNVDEDLKQEFLDAMDTCQAIAKCMPVEKAKSPVMKEFGNTISFMNCLFQKEMKVCTRKDVKKYAPLMGFEDDLEFSDAQDVMNEITDMITEGMSFIM